MNGWIKIVAGGAAAAAAMGVGIGAGLTAAGGSDRDVPITGDALDQATAAALAATGGGRVTGTEVADEDSYYEVEVTLDDGSQVDVQLDRNFDLVSTMADHEGAETNDGSGQ